MKNFNVSIVMHLGIEWHGKSADEVREQILNLLEQIVYLLPESLSHSNLIFHVENVEVTGIIDSDDNDLLNEEER